jgi:hypothetical protein
MGMLYNRAGLEKGQDGTSKFTPGERDEDSIL